MNIKRGSIHACGKASVKGGGAPGPHRHFGRAASPRLVAPVELFERDAGSCLDGEDYARGLAFAWARYVG